MVKASSTNLSIETYLKELCLSGIGSCYEKNANDAAHESLSFQQYLFGLLEAESAHRRQKRIARYRKHSQLIPNKTFANFETGRLPRVVTEQLSTIRKGNFVDHKENILLFGNQGSGKTHLLNALGHELIEEDKRVYFSPCVLLVQELLFAKRQLQLPRMIQRLAKFEVLIIDDIGYVEQSREEMEVLFTLLAERYERHSVMLTSNLPFSQWEKIFKDPMITAAAIDRLVHHSIILELNVSSYRMEEAKTKKQKKVTKKETPKKVKKAGVVEV